MRAYIKTDESGKKTTENGCIEPCAIERGMQLIGRKWTGSLIWHLRDGPVRFNDLVRLLEGASRKIVDQRLKELESRGMVERKVVSEKPIAVTYELTGFGRSALSILEKIQDWSESNRI